MYTQKKHKLRQRKRSVGRRGRGKRARGKKSPRNLTRVKSNTMNSMVRPLLSRVRSASNNSNDSYYAIKNIIHETSIPGLMAILGSGGLKTQRQRIKDGISAPPGQGGPSASKREILTHLKSINDENYWKPRLKDGWDAEGLFFRVEFNTENKIHSPVLKSMVQSAAFVFHPNLLAQKKSWILNSTENNGMFLGEIGKIGESPLTGYNGITYDYTNIHEFPNNSIPVDATDAELLIYDNVDISLLKEIRFKKKAEYDTFKDAVKALVPKHVKISVFKKP